MLVFYFLLPFLEQEYGIINKRENADIAGTIQLYAVTTTGQEVMFPLETMATDCQVIYFLVLQGVLIALEAMRGKSWKNWIPLISETMDVLL